MVDYLSRNCIDVPPRYGDSNVQSLADRIHGLIHLLPMVVGLDLSRQEHDRVGRPSDEFHAYDIGTRICKQQDC